MCKKQSLQSRSDWPLIGSFEVRFDHRHTHSPSQSHQLFTDKSRYRPWWDVTIAGPPRCPVWCRLTAMPIAISQAPRHYVVKYLCNNSRHLQCSPGARYSKLLKKILRKSYEKLKKILRKTYDHCLPIIRKIYDELTKKLRNAKKGLEN